MHHQKRGYKKIINRVKIRNCVEKTVRIVKNPTDPALPEVTHICIYYILLYCKQCIYIYIYIERCCNWY